MSYKFYNIIILFLLSSSFGFGQSSVDVNKHQEDSLLNSWKQQVLNKPLPAFLAAGADGVVDNASLKGKVTYINMWEAACAPCMAEMRALNKLYDTLKDNPDFQFISLTSGDNATIKQIKTKYHIGYNVSHLDEDGCYQLNRGMGYPTSIIVDRNSHVIYVHPGGYTDSASIWRFIFLEEIYPVLKKQL
jgi:thiol-disulfide isomerase/thioredoxin